MAATYNCFCLAYKNQTKKWNLCQETLVDDDADCVNYLLFWRKLYSEFIRLFAVEAS